MFALRPHRLALSIIIAQLTALYSKLLATPSIWRSNNDRQWAIVWTVYWNAASLSDTLFTNLIELLYSSTLYYQLDKRLPTRAGSLRWVNAFFKWILAGLIGKAIAALLDGTPDRSINWRPRGFTLRLSSLPILYLVSLTVPVKYRSQFKDIVLMAWRILCYFVMFWGLFKYFQDKIGNDILAMIDGKISTKQYQFAHWLLSEV